MDPLSNQLACDCVQGYAHRDYDKLCTFLEKRIGRPVMVAYGENLTEILRVSPATVHLIVGKQGVVLFDAARAKIPVRPVARLTDKSGSTEITGLFVVRKDDPATSIEQLKGYKILFGPSYNTEKSAAAVTALKTRNIPVPDPIQTTGACSTSALRVVEKKADAALISSYALALLEGCDTIDKGALRVVGKTAGVAFVTVFATDALSSKGEDAIIDALLAVKEDKKLLAQIESKTGFLKVRREALPSAWPDWRGPGRDGLSPYVPSKLPDDAKFLWRKPMAGVGLAGLAVTPEYVIVSDKDKAWKRDIFRCLDADTGKGLWTIEYPAAGEMDFTNSPRANPVIHDGLVYLLGAFGDLHCAELSTGRVVWKRNIARDFGAKPPAWGMCSSPLVVDNKLIVNPGAKDASIAALELRTGKVVWKTPGEPTAYSSFIIGTFGGVRQIIGYDSISVGGWDPATGKRLWELLPKNEGDFNVPTPVNVGGKLLLTTENNGTRLYGFDNNGKINATPLAHNDDLSPDTSTPVVVGDRVFGCFAGLFCLDLTNGLKTVYCSEDDIFEDYAAMIGGNGRVLIVTVDGEIILIEASSDSYRAQSRLSCFKQTEIWSHPALVGDRLYLRTTSEVCCLSLD